MATLSRVLGLFIFCYLISSAARDSLAAPADRVSFQRETAGPLFGPESEIDASFNRRGIFRREIRGGRVGAVLVQPPGRTIIGLTALYNGRHELELYRLMTNGRHDQGFGESGLAYISSLDLFGQDADLTIDAAQIQSDRKLLILVRSQDPSVSRSARLLRFTENGQLDVHFGHQGVLTLPMLESAGYLLLRERGPVLVAGMMAHHPGILRISDSGEVDMDAYRQFIQSRPPTLPEAHRVIATFLSSGEILLAINTTPGNLALIRFGENGLPLTHSPEGESPFPMRQISTGLVTGEFSQLIATPEGGAQIIGTGLDSAQMRRLVSLSVSPSASPAPLADEAGPIRRSTLLCFGETQAVATTADSRGHILANVICSGQNLVSKLAPEDHTDIHSGALNVPREGLQPRNGLAASLEYMASESITPFIAVDENDNIITALMVLPSAQSPNAELIVRRLTPISPSTQTQTRNQTLIPSLR